MNDTQYEIMNNTQYAKKLFEAIKTRPIPGVEKRKKLKIEQLKNFLVKKGLLEESNNLKFIDDIACFSEVGYSMRKIISEPLITTIELDNGDTYNFSISPYNEEVPYPYDLICISNKKYDITFIFDIELFAGAHINGVPVDYIIE
jgi:hypothetical protein